MKSLITPKTIVGARNNENKNSLDLNYNLLAYGSQSNVVIQELENLQIIQAMSYHKSSVTAVKFNPTNINNNLETPYCLTLVSGDSEGVAVVWSVATGSVLSVLRAPSYRKRTTNESNVETKETTKRKKKKTKKAQTNSIQSPKKTKKKNAQPYAIKNFWWISNSSDTTRKKKYEYLLIYHSPGILRLWFIGEMLKDKPKLMWESDFDVEVVSIDLDPKRNSLIVAAHPQYIYKISSLDFENPIKLPKSYFKISSLSSKIKLTEVRQIHYYPHNSKFTFFLFFRELFIFDNQLSQIVDYRAVTNKPPFWKIVFSKSDDSFFYILHQDASLSLWSFQIQEKKLQLQMLGFMDHYLISRSPKVTPTQKINFCLKSKNKRDYLYFISEYGVIWEWACPSISPQILSNRSTFQLALNENNQNEQRNNGTSYSMPIGLFGVYEPIRTQPKCISVCPFNRGARSKIAVGTERGLIQIYDLRYNESKKVYSVFKSPVLQIEWITPNLILCSTSVPTTANTFRNTVKFLDIDSGDQQNFPRSKEMETVQVSRFELTKSRRYLAILFEKGTCELWDLYNMNLIEALDISSNTTGSFCWIHNSNVDPNEEKIDSFLFSIFGRQELTQFYIKQHSIEKKKTLKLNLLNLKIVAMVSKSYSAAMAVEDGRIYYLNLKRLKIRQLKINNTQRKVKKIIFRPMKKTHVILILFVDGSVMMYDCKSDVELSINNKEERKGIPNSFKSAIEKKMFTDIDFVNKTSPILLSRDGSLHILNLKLNTINSPLKLSNIKNRPFSPQLYDKNFSLALKIIFQSGITLFKNQIRKTDQNSNETIKNQEGGKGKGKGKELKKNENNNKKEDDHDGKQKILSLMKNSITEQIDQYKKIEISLQNYYKNKEFLQLEPETSLKKTWKSIGLVKKVFSKGEIEINEKTIQRIDNLDKDIKRNNNINDKKIQKNEIKKQSLSLEQLLYREIMLLPKDLINGIKNSPDIPHRCYLTAKFFNDEEEIKFWNLTRFYLKKFQLKNINNKVSTIKKEKTINGEKIINDEEKKKNKNEGNDNEGKNTSNNKNGKEKEEFETLKEKKMKKLKKYLNSNGNKKKKENIKEQKIKEESLPKKYELLRQKDELIKENNNLITMRDNFRNQSQVNYLRVENDFLKYNQKETALEILLSTPQNDDRYYEKLLKSIVVSASINQTVFQKTLKLVSLNLANSNNLEESVQLLCSIGDYKNACKYLINQNKWEEALSICKLNMNENDSFVIFEQYINYLIQKKQEWEAIYFSLSIGMFQKVLEILIQINCFEIAYFFIISCQQFTFLLQKNDNTKITFLKFSKFLKLLGLEKYVKLSSKQEEQLVRKN
ncbi:wd repeat-containing protein [Anaeramoeba flamelloides]|uniref:Wd repeat-containing protein n=1 Tax=Anaeramoeba flamelloides TaxID=1746091 RepID=A0ABQ8Y248_9EUKA|nr:wd repeat-containing protein [Anaeramoeba flamelloides]